MTETQPPAIRTGAKYKWVPPARKKARKAKPPPAKKVKTPGQPQGPQPSASKSVPSKPDEDSEIADFKKGRSSWVWPHFDLVKENNNLVAYCIYCNRHYLAGGKSHGTSNLSHHLEVQCSVYLGMQNDSSKQQTLNFAKKEGTVSYSYENSRSKLIRMIIMMNFLSLWCNMKGLQRLCILYNLNLLFLVELLSLGIV